MSTEHRSIPSHNRVRRALAATSVAALLLATACGDDDDTAATTTTTTTQAAGEETTRPPIGDADLRDLLPDVSALDASYREAPPEDEDEEGTDDGDEVEDAMEEACPEAAALIDQDDDEDDVEQEYVGALDRSITVGLDPTPRNLDADSIDEAVAAISSCDTVSLTQDELDMTIDLEAERDDSFGDRGVLLTMDLSMSHSEFPAPITLEMRGRFFQVGSLGAQVDVTSGFDDTTFEPAAGDFDLLDTLAAELESGAEAEAG